MALLILAGVMDMIGLSAIIPIISILVDYQGTIENNYVQYVYQLLGAPTKNTFLVLLSAAAILLVWTSGIVGALSIYASQRFLKRLGADLAVRVYQHYLQQSIRQFYSRPQSEYARNINGISERITHGIIGASATIIARTVQIIIVFALLLAVNHKVTITITLTLLMSYTAIYFAVRKHVRKISLENMHETRALQQLIIGSYRAYRNILINDLTRTFESHFSKLKKSAARKTADLQIIGSSPRQLIETIGISLLILASLTIGMASDGSGQFVAIMALFGVAAYRLLPAAQQVFQNLNSLTSAAAAYQLVATEWGQLDQPEKPGKNRPSPTQHPTSLTVSNLSYSYDENLVFRNLNIDLRLTGFIRITGPSGAGKSTLIDILTGLRVPDEGEVFINDAKLSVIEKSEWWNNISYLSQDDYVFPGTTQENIVLQNQPFNRQRLETIAEICGLSTLEPGETQHFNPHRQIGEGGINLSGGQKNRILLARTLYKETKIVFLDEAFSALDLKTSKEIIKNIRTHFPERCFIVISHRAQEFPSFTKTIKLNINSAQV